mmetsp:Transcript_25690/g.67215  ORF Transcript_25690/g.67215 Transcript_25690/m.67215 type:complete len:87 (+) Transcript_25690:1158-1418(+)
MSCPLHPLSREGLDRTAPDGAKDMLHREGPVRTSVRGPQGDDLGVTRGGPRNYAASSVAGAVVSGFTGFCSWQGTDIHTTSGESDG